MSSAPPPDVAALRAQLRSRCSGTVVVDPDDCARLAVMAAGGEGGPADLRLAADAAAAGCSGKGAGDSSRAVRSKACILLAEAARDGQHHLQNDAISDSAFVQACALGETAACDAVKRWYLAISPDGRWIAGLDPWKARVRVWSLETGVSPYSRDQGEQLDAVIWAPDSRALRLVGAVDWSKQPEQGPSLLVDATDWVERPAGRPIPRVFGWLGDGRLVSIDPNGTSLRTVTEQDDREKVVHRPPTDSVACDASRCVARIGRASVEGSLVIDAGGPTREAPAFASWIPGSRAAWIDGNEAFDLVSFQKRELRGAMRGAGPLRLFVSERGAWYADGDELTPFDPKTFESTGNPVRVAGLTRCGLEATNASGCAWDAPRSKIVVQRGGSLAAIDMFNGEVVASIDMGSGRR